MVPSSGNAYSLGTDVAPWGPAYFTQTGEAFTTLTGSSGTVVHNWLSQGAVYLHSSITTNFTANITNLPTTNNRSYVVVLNLQQGSLPYYANAVQINSSAATINWINGATPTPAANKFEAESLTIYRIAGGWTVVGQYASFG
jgi:hypothetical protein